MPRHITGHWLDVLSRAGSAAKGLVFLTVGVLAFRVAFGMGGETVDLFGAVGELAQAPFAMALLIAMTVGLYGYTAWRVIQCFGDTENHGRSLSAWWSRTSYLAIGIAYGSIAIYATAMVFGTGGETNGNSEGMNDAKDWTALALSQPFGRTLVGLAGLLVIAGGVYDLWYALTRGFKWKFEAEEFHPVEKIAIWFFAMYGHTARGLVYGLVGVLVIRAAIRFDPEEAGSVGEAFDEVLAQPFGTWLLAVAAGGFVAYGLYCFMVATHRRAANVPAGETPRA